MIRMNMLHPHPAEPATSGWAGRGMVCFRKAMSPSPGLVMWLQMVVESLRFRACQSNGAIPR